MLEFIQKAYRSIKKENQELVIQPFLFNWPRQTELAIKTAKQLENIQLEEAKLLPLIVINSDVEADRAGWVNIGDKYFGSQWAKAMELHTPGAVLLHIQADATYGDWKALLEDFIAINKKFNWGLVSPDISRTYWDTRFDIEELEGNIRKVLHSDCTTWFIHPAIIKKVRETKIDWHLSELGWGIDLVFNAVSLLQKRLVLRDYKHQVVHHGAQNYTAKEANIQMQEFVDSLPKKIQKQIQNIRFQQTKTANLTPTRT